jgi:ABC-type uncharacterized transport system substrate-binding protein
MNWKEQARNWLALFALAACLALSPARAEVAATFPTAPVNKPDGSKWRIGVFESGPYIDYAKMFQATAEGLQTMGWLTLPKDIPAGLSDESWWRFLAENMNSDYIEFVPDAFWSDDFDEIRRLSVRQDIRMRTQERRDIDLILALGTWAGQDMAAIQTPVPTIVASASDPVASGIIRSIGDSGQDNMNASIPPEHYLRQVRLFHEFIPFKKLGLIFENTPEGRTYAAIEDVETVARELGFELITCEAPFLGADLHRIEQSVFSCYEDLIRKVDAIYITEHRGTDGKGIERVSALLRQAKIPSFSMRNAEEVEAGILMGMAQSNYSYTGLFHAETIARVLRGAKPRQLSQVLRESSKIALNLETARSIGFDPPVNALLVADDIYGDGMPDLPPEVLSAAPVEAPAAQSRGLPPAPKNVLPVFPVGKSDGSKWRLGVFESGPYDEYARMLRIIVEGLRTLGWLALSGDIPTGLSSESLWRFLGENARSDYIEFVPDAFWTDDFDKSRRVFTRQHIRTRVRERRDIDLILALGTWAGQDMADIQTPVPTIVASATDPIAAGIVKSAEDSGQDNLHARVSPGHYLWQVRLFRELIPFGKLGLVFENSPVGRSYAALEDVETVAREQGFELITCEAQYSDIDLADIQREVLSCYEDLSRKVDAVYVTRHRGTDGKGIAQVSALLRQAKIPSFSMRNVEEVKAGILMGMAQADYAYIGLFHAENIARILRGAKPRQLSQVMYEPARIALNLETARMIGFDPPIDVLLAADDVFGVQELRIRSLKDRKPPPTP